MEYSTILVLTVFDLLAISCYLEQCAARNVS